MAEIMIPSREPITKGQIGTICDRLAVALRKDEKNFPSNTSQLVIENHIDKFVNEAIASFKRLVDSVSKIIVRHVNVKRHQTAEKAVKATGRRQYIDKDVVLAMPNGEGDEAEVHFVNFGETVKAKDLEAKLDALGYKLADPFSLCKVNEDDPLFADEHSNCTQWKRKDGSGNYCCAAFIRGGGGRSVFIRQLVDDWPNHWWFACFRK